MTVLLYADDRFAAHDTGPWHPEQPARLAAVTDGLLVHDLDEAVTPIHPRPATDAELTRVHPIEFVRGLERFCLSGHTELDADTIVSERSADLARLASGAGLDAVERLQAGEGTAAFVAVRPPGHHATSNRAMGFCLFNHVAVAAAALAEQGERVAVVDFDAHHGNGTEEIFYERSDVLYVSWHQHPLYPGTGRASDVGRGDGVGATMNIPLPPGATGEHLRRTVEELVAPAVIAHGTTWLLISAGYDAHRKDPLTDMGLTSGDFADLTADLVSLVPPGRVVAFLEGGYDLGALADSAAATVGALLGEKLHPERPSSGGPGDDVVEAVAELRRRAIG